MNIFVYGTLLKGLEREYVLADSDYLGRATIKAELFDLGCYPGIIEGSSTVFGELYEISGETLMILDRIEGYIERDLEASLFIRKKVLTTKLGDNISVEAFCYFYNGAEIRRKNLSR